MGSQRCGGPGGETVLGNVRRFVLLSVLALLISAAAAVVMPKANASPAPPAPVQMNYAWR